MSNSGVSDDKILEKVGAFRGKNQGRTEWAVSGDWTEELFASPHDYPLATRVFSMTCHCAPMGDTSSVLAPGGTWLDLWKAVDKLRNAPGVYCDHRWIERFTLVGNRLKVDFGS